jgi:hypothetical protein
LVSQSPLDESFDNKKRKVWSSNPKLHKAQLEDQKDKESLRRSYKRRKNRRANKSTKNDKQGKEQRKAQNQNMASKKGSNSKTLSEISFP